MPIATTSPAPMPLIPAPAAGPAGSRRTTPGTDPAAGSAPGGPASGRPTPWLRAGRSRRSGRLSAAAAGARDPAAEFSVRRLAHCVPRGLSQPGYCSRVALTASWTLPLIAREIGQLSLASSAISRNFSLPMPGTSPERRGSTKRPSTRRACGRGSTPWSRPDPARSRPSRARSRRPSRSTRHALRRAAPPGL